MFELFLAGSEAVSSVESTVLDPKCIIVPSVTAPLSRRLTRWHRRNCLLSAEICVSVRLSPAFPLLDTFRWNPSESRIRVLYCDHVSLWWSRDCRFAGIYGLLAEDAHSSKTCYSLEETARQMNELFFSVS